MQRSKWMCVIVGIQLCVIVGIQYFERLSFLSCLCLLLFVYSWLGIGSACNTCTISLVRMSIKLTNEPKRTNYETAPYVHTIL